MTTKETAEALGITERTVQRRASELGLTVNGVLTNLDEKAVTLIKKMVERSGRTDLDNVVELPNISTELEMMILDAKVTEWKTRRIEELQKQLAESNRKNAILMHVSKTYTASEIAKELGLRSAQELNQAMCDCKMQYKQNGTWLPCAQYSDRGFFDIKQMELDNGKVIYDRRITQTGREFLLEQFSCEQNSVGVK